VKDLKWCALHQIKYAPEHGCALCASVKEIAGLRLRQDFDRLTREKRASRLLEEAVDPAYPPSDPRRYVAGPVDLAPPPESPDMVNSPPHYANGEIECIDAMKQVFGLEAVQQYALINHFKYLWRARYKGTEKQDMEKADWYWRFSQGDDPRAKT